MLQLGDDPFEPTVSTPPSPPGRTLPGVCSVVGHLLRLHGRAERAVEATKMLASLGTSVNSNYSGPYVVVDDVGTDTGREGNYAPSTSKMKIQAKNCEAWKVDPYWKHWRVSSREAPYLCPKALSLLQMNHDLLAYLDAQKIQRAGSCVEVVQFCWKYNQGRLQELFKDEGCEAKLRVDSDGKPYVTDNSNYIVDLYFKNPIRDSAVAGKDIYALEGVVEHGQFLDMTTTVIIAGKSGVDVKTK